MKIKYEVLNPSSMASVNKFMACDKLPIAVVWELFDAIKVVKAENEKYTHMINAVIAKHGKDGQVVFKNLTKEQREAFDSDVALIDEKEFEIPLKEKIKLPENSTGFNIQDLFNLQWLIVR